MFLQMPLSITVGEVLRTIMGKTAMCLAGTHVMKSIYVLHCCDILGQLFTVEGKELLSLEGAKQSDSLAVTIYLK